MVHARGTPDLFCVFPARYITYVCVHIIRRTKKRADGEDRTKLNAVYPIIPGLIYTYAERD